MRTRSSTGIEPAAHRSPLVPQIVPDLPGNQVPGICLKLHAPLRVEIGHRVHQPDVPDLVKVLHGNPGPGVAPGYLVHQGHEERGESRVQLGAAEGTVGTKEDDDIIRRGGLPDWMRRSSVSHKNAPLVSASPKIHRSKSSGHFRVAEEGKQNSSFGNPADLPAISPGRSRSFAPPGHPGLAFVARTPRILTNC